MPAQRLSIGPECFLGRTHDTPPFEVGQVAGEVVKGVELPGGDDLVHLRDPEQTLIEGQVAHSAQCHAVRWPVVLRLPPRNDVGRSDCRVTVDGTYSDTAQGATMEIRGADPPPEALVADGGAIRFFHEERLLYPGIFGMAQQLFAVDESATVDRALLEDGSTRFR